MRIKRIAKATLSVLLLFVMTVSAVGCGAAPQPKPKQWMSYDYFDTYVTFYDYSKDGDDAFRQRRDTVAGVIKYYHELFDIYEPHEGVAGLYEINSKAGVSAVTVDEELIDFLVYAKEMYALTDGAVNIAMGSLLSLWHEYREGGVAIPSYKELTARAEHCDIDSIVIDREASTVMITDPEASLDVGAIGKGYAVEMAAKSLLALGATSCVVDGGGNLRTIGTKPDGKGWVTAITNPRAPAGADFSHKVILSDSSMATSGDYQRYYVVDGVRYHHIIDGETLMPAREFSSVSVMCESAALADALSTALFVTSYEDGLRLVEGLDGVEALWIFSDGEMKKTAGMK